MVPNLTYCTLAWSEVEVPTPLLTVAETEAMACRSVLPVDTGPVRLKEIVTSNRPPKVCEETPSNHRAAPGPRSEVNVVVVKWYPEAGLNVTLSDPRLRGVE